METVHNFDGLRLESNPQGDIYILEGNQTVAIFPASNPNREEQAKLMIQAPRMARMGKSTLYLFVCESLVSVMSAHQQEEVRAMRQRLTQKLRELLQELYGDE